MMEYVPRRFETTDDYSNSIPVHVVWEVTLACNLSCQHCGSRAGKKRKNELTTDECFEVIESLWRLGTREITLIGGEAFLRKDWLSLVSKITSLGMDCSMQTGALHFNEQRILDAKNAGVKNIGVSVDGLETSHNRVRGNPQSFRHAVACLELLKKHTIISSVNTVIHQENKNELPELLQLFISLGVKNWQVQLAVAMGNLVDNSHLIIQPYEVKEIHDNLFELYQKGLMHDLLIQPGNNIGYFGPHEHEWRQSKIGHFQGCSAGQTAMGIEADGNIKGCPSLPTTDYTGGNVRNMKLEDIFRHTSQLSFTRYRNKEELWGYCKSCYYADVCLAGCTWTSHVLFGRRGNNPYCYHRATELAKQNRFEKLVKIKNAEGAPFDYGLFEIVVLNEKGEEMERQAPSLTAELFPASGNQEVRIPRELHLCKNCKNFVYDSKGICPFCHEDIERCELEYHKNMMEAKRAYAVVESILNSDEYKPDNDI